VCRRPTLRSVLAARLPPRRAARRLKPEIAPPRRVRGDVGQAEGRTNDVVAGGGEGRRDHGTRHPSACTRVPYGCDGQARGLRWMTSPRRRPTGVLLDITTEGGGSFHVSTHLGRDERVGQVDGKFEVLTIPVSDVDRSKAFYQR